MIYPKDIVDCVSQDAELRKRFPWVRQNSALNVSSSSDEPVSLDFEQYMLNEGYTSSSAIRRYLNFMAVMHGTFNNITHYFPKSSATRPHKDFTCTTGTAPFELMHHAMYLYYLDSYGVVGDVIECGAFKGYSACCLSWVCDYLGRRLIVADSFEGLPQNETDPYYEKGDFRGDFEEVTRNIASLGRIGCVDFVRGFFNESLQEINRPLCMIWMDVDLYESTMDVMNHLYDHLSVGGVIFSHELFKESFEAGQLKRTIGPAKALYDFFKENKMSYQAMPLESGTGLVVPCQEGEKLLMSVSHSKYLRDNCMHDFLQPPHEAKKMIEERDHWRNETYKAIDAYQGTVEFKVKKIVKTLFGMGKGQ